MTNPLLDVKNLNVTFKMQGQEIHAVRGIDLTLSPGESLGIVGESGCGKTAMAKALVKFLPLETTQVSGEIWYQNENLVTYSKSKMQGVYGKEIGMIFQDPATSLNPTLTIGTQIIEGYRQHFRNATWHEAKQIAVEMLNKVGIDQALEVMEAYPDALSGGMRQRVMISLALICKPKILLADEPTTALDVTIQLQIIDLLKHLQKEMGMAIILITHDIGLVSQFCDRALVMYAGKIVESAYVAQLFTDPKHPYTQRLLQALPRPDQSTKGILTPIEGTPPNLALPLNYCSFCTRCSKAMNICGIAVPPLFEVGHAHWSACFKHDPRGSVNERDISNNSNI